MFETHHALRVPAAKQTHNAVSPIHATCNHVARCPSPSKKLQFETRARLVGLSQSSHAISASVPGHLALRCMPVSHLGSSSVSFRPLDIRWATHYAQLRQATRPTESLLPAHHLNVSGIGAVASSRGRRHIDDAAGCMLPQLQQPFRVLQCILHLPRVLLIGIAHCSSRVVDGSGKGNCGGRSVG